MQQAGSVARVAPPLSSRNGSVGAAVRLAPRSALRRCGPPRAASGRSGRLRSISRPHRHLVHHRRGHPHPWLGPRNPSHECRHHGHRQRTRFPGGHDRCSDGHDSTAPARELFSTSPRPHRGLLYFPRRQRRRWADAPRRPAAVSRFLARCSLSGRCGCGSTSSCARRWYSSCTSSAISGSGVERTASRDSRTPHRRNLFRSRARSTSCSSWARWVPSSAPGSGTARRVASSACTRRRGTCCATWCFSRSSSSPGS